MEESYLIETPRLGIRPLMMKDAEALFGILSDKEVMHFSVEGPHQHLAHTEAFITKCIAHYEEYSFHIWGVMHLEDERLIGTAGLLIQDIDGTKEIELTYRLARSYWGQGLGTEAAKGVRDYGFKILAMNRLISLIEPGNLASIGVAQKIGMIYKRDTVFHEKPVQVHAVEKF